MYRLYILDVNYIFDMFLKYGEKNLVLCNYINKNPIIRFFWNMCLYFGYIQVCFNFSGRKGYWSWNNEIPMKMKPLHFSRNIEIKKVCPRMEVHLKILFVNYRKLYEMCLHVRTYFLVSIFH